MRNDTKYLLPVFKYNILMKKLQSKKKHYFLNMTMDQKYCPILETLIIPKFGKNIQLVTCMYITHHNRLYLIGPYACALN